MYGGNNVTIIGKEMSGCSWPLCKPDAKLVLVTVLQVYARYGKCTMFSFLIHGWCVECKERWVY